MKKYLAPTFVVILASVLLVLCPLLSYAQEALSTPSGAVMRMATQMKAQGSYLATLDYIHWPSVFLGISPEPKLALNVKNPEQLRDVYKGFFEDPAGLMRDRLEERLDGVPEEKRTELKQSMELVMAKVSERFKEENEKLKRSEFSVVEEKIEGDRASVKLALTLDGDTKDKTVQLIKVEDRWYLTSPMKSAEQK